MAAKGQVSSVLVGEVAKLDIGTGVCYDLEEVGARIWEWVEELRLVEEIQAVMLEEYEVYVVSGRHNVLRLLQELSSKGLVEVKNDAPA